MQPRASKGLRARKSCAEAKVSLWYPAARSKGQEPAVRPHHHPLRTQLEPRCSLCISEQGVAPTSRTESKTNLLSEQLFEVSL
jgi:hypothetical protein